MSHPRMTVGPRLRWGRRPELHSHTAIQLYEQLHRDGYPDDALSEVARGLQLAVRLFGCRYQYTNVPFMVHVIGTASVLSMLRAPTDLVVAGLIHNAYGNGDFGDARGGAAEWKRRRVRDVVGPEVEAHVFEFWKSLRWTSERIDEIARDVGALDAQTRVVALIRLADLVEHYRDLGAVYGGRRATAEEFITRQGDAWVRLAGALGGPSLAGELRRLFAETRSAEVPEELCDLTGRAGSFARIPRSQTLRLPVKLRRTAARVRDGVSRRLVRPRDRASGRG